MGGKVTAIPTPATMKAAKATTDEILSASFTVDSRVDE
jgi:hypothetical protein